MIFDVTSKITGAYVGRFSAISAPDLIKALDVQYPRGCPFCALNPATTKVESAVLWADIRERS